MSLMAVGNDAHGGVASVDTRCNSDIFTDCRVVEVKSTWNISGQNLVFYSNLFIDWTLNWICYTAQYFWVTQRPHFSQSQLHISETWTRCSQVIYSWVVFMKDRAYGVGFHTVVHCVVVQFIRCAALLFYCSPVGQRCLFCYKAWYEKAAFVVEWARQRHFFSWMGLVLK